MNNHRLLQLVLLTVCGTLLSAWGWWVTTAIEQANTQRSGLMVEWSQWRGQITEQHQALERDLILTKKELEEIKLYLRARGWKQKADKPAPQEREPAVLKEYSPEAG